MSSSSLIWRPPPRLLRQFAGLWILFFGAVAAWQGPWRGHERPALALLSVAAVGLAGLRWPGVMRPLWVTWMCLAFPIGWLVSHLILACLFYGLFTPVAVVFRWRGRDALALKPKPAENSYWRPKPAPENLDSYFRQS